MVHSSTLWLNEEVICVYVSVCALVYTHTHTYNLYMDGTWHTIRMCISSSIQTFMLAFHSHIPTALLGIKGPTQRFISLVMCH